MPKLNVRSPIVVYGERLMKLLLLWVTNITAQNWEIQECHNPMIYVSSFGVSLLQHGFPIGVTCGSPWINFSQNICNRNT